MKKQIKELEAHLYKEQILPREEELNKTYQIFVKQIVVNNTQLIDQQADQHVLKTLSQKMRETKIQKGWYNPNNYIWMKDGQVRDFENKMMSTITNLLDEKKIQDDFNEFIKKIADTYRKLAKIVITEILVRQNTSESE